MCGIAGYIGHSKRPKLSFKLITNIFNHLEIRGTDASGVWGTEFGEDGRVVYHKEPIRSSEFIQKPFWYKLKKIKTDMLLVHARATSKDGGDPNNNINNHPFVNNDKSIGLVHNGTIGEANEIKNIYETQSDTDSECLLRIFEHGLESDFELIQDTPDYLCRRVSGIEKIWSYVHSGAMAVAIGERIDEHKRGLLLFRNEQRPLWIADLRNELGQIFFFSSPDIWTRSIYSNDVLKNQLKNNQKLIEIPHGEIWYFYIDEKNRYPFDEQLYKFKINIESKTELEKSEFISIRPNKLNLKIITNLKNQAESSNLLKYDENLWKSEEEKNEYFCDDKNYKKICEEIIIKTKNIESKLDYIISNNIKINQYDQILDYLIQNKLDLDYIEKIID
jgi:glucosamine 6-phosphate synthetase-like amidotransferase/phosphosugar isomerase protein